MENTDNTVDNYIENNPDKDKDNNMDNNINKDYDFEIENITGKIKKGNFKLVGLQFPEGLKGLAVKIKNKQYNIPNI